MATRSSNASGLRRKPRQVRSQERVNRILEVAQALFVAQGYSATTTNEIAAQAQVPIGSLYQFFPDKAAILQALAMQYSVQLRKHLTEFLDTAEVAALPLPEYVEQLVDATNQFFLDNPGYHAIFMEVQGTMPEVNKIDQALDMQLIQDLSAAFSQRNAALSSEDYEAIAFVMVKAMGNLLWLSLSQKPALRQRLVAETKRLALNYLQSYFPMCETSF